VSFYTLLFYFKILNVNLLVYYQKITIIIINKTGGVQVEKMKAILAVVILIMALTNLSVAITGNVFNVKDYGAVGDGVTLDSDAINKTIGECVKAGGGTVYFPAGTYLSGSIRLKSNLTLYLDAGATILGAPNDINAYDYPDDKVLDEIRQILEWGYEDYGHTYLENSLIWGENLENIAIIGQGTINGGGMTHHDSVPVGGGNKAIGLKLCKNITIKDITIYHGAHFAMQYRGCDNMTIDNVIFDTQRDALNLDCCRNVRVSNCIINAPRDDGLCFKSSLVMGFARKTENVTVTNCILSGYKEGSVIDGTYMHDMRNDGKTTETEPRGGPWYPGAGTGRIRFGSESSGAFSNIVITNCVFDYSRGFDLNIYDGGIMENINISNITMRNIPNPPITIKVHDRGRGPEGTTIGKIKDVSFSNILVYPYNNLPPGHPDLRTRRPCIINGLPGHEIENLRLNNIKMVSLHNNDGVAKDKVTGGYTGGYRGGNIHSSQFASYGFYCAYVKGLKMTNIDVGFESPDKRPAFIFENVEGLELDNVSADRAVGNESPIIFKNVEDVVVRDCSDFPEINSQYKDIKLSKKKVLTDETFSVSVKATSANEGVNKIELFEDGKLFKTRHVWLNANEVKEISFTDLLLNTSGKHKLTVGNCHETQTITIAQK
jgi:hypothetical protein